MQVAIEDNLAQYQTITFQVALLYTSSKGRQIALDHKRPSFIALGERRIRVHTLSLPVSATLKDVYSNADQEAVAALIAKMGQLQFDLLLNSMLVLI
jgi:protein transport protein SEC24